MDSQSSSLDFAVIGHQDNWQTITSFVNAVRYPGSDKLSTEKLKDIYPFIPPRGLFRVNVRSKTGIEINGVYIDTFIDPDKLGNSHIRANINKVMKAISLTKKINAKMVALGGFTSIVMEGNFDPLEPCNTAFTTGNTLTAAYIVKGIEQASASLNINLSDSNVLIIGATGDIGLACTHYLKHKVKKLLLCARNIQRLEKLAATLLLENISVVSSTSLNELVAEADIIISAASSSGIKLVNYKKNVLICDAGYPKNLETKIENNSGFNLFHGGMGQVHAGFSFNPDYSASIYKYAAPYIIHGCILEAMVLAFENRSEPYSNGKGNITCTAIDAIYDLSIKHGITVAPFYNTNGLWHDRSSLKI